MPQIQIEFDSAILKSCFATSNNYWTVSERKTHPCWYVTLTIHQFHQPSSIIAPLNFNNIAPENGWLVDDPASFCGPVTFLVSFGCEISGLNGMILEKWSSGEKGLRGRRERHPSQMDSDTRARRKHAQAFKPGARARSQLDTPVVLEVFFCFFWFLFRDSMEWDYGF